MHKELHVQHEAKRYASEVIEVNGRTVRVRGGVMPSGAPMLPGMRAVGTLAYASIYSQGLHPSREKPKRDWSVEVRHSSGHWITAERRMQGDNVEQARNLVRGNPHYRLVRVGINGGEVIERV